MIPNSKSILLSWMNRIFIMMGIEGMVRGFSMAILKEMKKRGRNGGRLRQRKRSEFYIIQSNLLTLTVF